MCYIWVKYQSEKSIFQTVPLLTEYARVGRRAFILPWSLSRRRHTRSVVCLFIHFNPLAKFTITPIRLYRARPAVYRRVRPEFWRNENRYYSSERPKCIFHWFPNIRVASGHLGQNSKSSETRETYNINCNIVYYYRRCRFREIETRYVPSAREYGVILRFRENSIFPLIVCCAYTTSFYLCEVRRISYARL